MPRRAPIKWVLAYFGVIGVAGIFYHQALGFIRPNAPDFASEYIYAVPARRDDFYVSPVEAYLLRGFAGHFAVMFVWVGLISLTNADERLRRRSGD